MAIKTQKCSCCEERILVVVNALAVCANCDLVERWPVMAKAKR